jgi:hypothetical protein
MEMNRKMISDLVILVGIVMGVIGWGGRDSGGLGAVISYLILAFGAGFVLWGFYRYLKGYHQPKE